MHDPDYTENARLALKLKRTRFRAAVFLLVERLTDSLWRLATWTGFFGGLWLFQLPGIFGKSGLVGAFVLFAGGCIYFLWKDALRFRWPSRNDIDLRIEHESALKHRPLAALGDSLANPQKQRTRNLWDESRARIIHVLQLIRSGKPHAFLAARDPYAVRLGVLMFFALGIYVAGPTWNERLMVGLRPLDIQFQSANTDNLVLWITPPQYTGIAPIVIKGKGDGKIIDIPEKSILKFSVRGGFGVPHLTAREKDIPFTEAENGDYILETPAPPGDVLRIKQNFFPRISWHYRVLPDEPPKIAMQKEVEITENGSMRFALEVQDDYGVKNLKMNVVLDFTAQPTLLGEPVNESRIVMSPPKTVLPMQPVYDLAAHTWAGLPVMITFTAEDGRGQTASAEPVHMNLPERKFQHPVAKHLIDLRKKLALQPEENYVDLARELEDMMVRPHEYLDDHVVFLALRAASSRLFWAEKPSKETARTVISLLWDIALRIEGGEISIAARNLRDSQRALEKALENPDVTQEEISKLMSDLRSAMMEYFIELQREMQKRMAEGQQIPMMPPEMMAQNIDPEALANFMEQLEAQMMADDKKSAQEMLGQLQRLMDMMDPSMAGPMPPDMQMMSDGIDRIQEILKRQKELLAQTQKETQAMDRGFGDSLIGEEKLPQDWDMGNMPPPPTAPPKPPSEIFNFPAHRDEQESLRGLLGEVMMDAGEALGEVPDNMGSAEQEMRGSSEAFTGNEPDLSIPHQQQAIKYLEQAQKQLSQQLMARMQQMTGMAMMQGGMKFDPLGRPFGSDGNRNGLFPGSPVKIPDEAERKKAQELLKLIRKKSGELERPEGELEYYKRLLKQF